MDWFEASRPFVIATFLMYGVLSIILSLKHRDRQGFVDRFCGWFSGLFILYLLLLLISYSVTGGVVLMLALVNVTVSPTLLLIVSNVVPIIVAPIIVMRLP